MYFAWFMLALFTGELKTRTWVSVLEPQVLMTLVVLIVSYKAESTITLTCSLPTGLRRPVLAGGTSRTIVVRFGQQ